MSKSIIVTKHRQLLSRRGDCHAEQRMTALNNICPHGNWRDG
jgi:hypothetical protein